MSEQDIISQCTTPARRIPLLVADLLCRLLIGWGTVSTFLGFTKSFGGLVAARFFLGLCEGGLLGGMVVMLAMFYRRHQMLYRIGIFYCAAPLSGAFGGLLATGLAKIKHGGYNRKSRYQSTQT
jgi:MFS family permease